jgi:HPt (histidine-containing phosphotransfer) domain-containing protein
VSDLPTIDPEAIANLRDLNPGDGGEFLREIVSIYVEDTPKRISEMKASQAAGDTATFARAAHTIKGSSANVGAMVLRGIAERLEALARKEGLGGVSSLVADCEREFERASAELKRLAE